MSPITPPPATAPAFGGKLNGMNERCFLLSRSIFPQLTLSVDQRFACTAPAAAGAFGAAPGGFGQPQPTQTGSSMAPYQTTTKQDGTNQIVLQAITAMQQYEGKSFEELRLEDYMAGNKGTKGQAAPAPTGFGGFGAAPQPGKRTSG